MPKFQTQNMILLDYAAKNVMFSTGWVSQFCAKWKESHVFSNHHIFKCFSPPLPSVLHGHSLRSNDIFLWVARRSKQSCASEHCG